MGDEKNRVYKLDVQPKAPMDRVRLRSNNSSSNSQNEVKSTAEKPGAGQNPLPPVSTPQPQTQLPGPKSSTNPPTNLPPVTSGGERNGNGNTPPTVAQILSSNSHLQNLGLQEIHQWSLDQLKSKLVELARENQGLKTAIK